MEVPKNLYYTKEHEWVLVEGDEGKIGITDYAQSELGDIVFVELPEPGLTVIRGGAFGTIEAVKAASDLFSPISGEVTAINGLLDQEPELINNSPYTDGWIATIKFNDPKEVETLLSADAYAEIIDKIKG